ncbi:hypothetical protein CHS0354_034521 [Potamilus streckersoni]|uniref:Hepatocyte growth factor-regulated tyrosine kinase substrate n=1 Tax=Potamilus streckersoni TaxID=2493646 RepID=A0AAE0SGH9_9BIVA|nr:hypothetical protein CHS0354_034521 [Potamilus streckersoni]
MFGNKSMFERSLEKATSQLLLEPDWDSVLQICDCIRQGDVPPKQAVSTIKKKIGVENPHVSLYALQVLESCVKNCGSPIHSEIATKEFMEFMKHQASTRADPVKAKVSELVQVWSHAFRNEPSYKVVQDTFNMMKLEGHTFPTLKEADAMFMADKAPDWKDGECCTRCRVAFGMVQRKHHCRNCGEVFCGKCSSKTSIIPRFGIEKEVRVCDACYSKLNSPAKKPGEEDLPSEYLASPLSKQLQVPPKKTEEELQEEEELALALALSQSEHENKEKERERLRSSYGLYAGTNNRSASPQSSKVSQPATVSAPMIDTSDMDPELARYLNRNYWKQRAEDTKTATTTQPSAPVATATESKAMDKVAEKQQEVYQNGETDDSDQEQFLNALHSSVEIFVNRMRSNSMRGRSIATDSSVQSLFTVIGNMHPQLLKYIQEREDARSSYEALQDKLAQLKDAREALDALREDHLEKRRREREEFERQRQIQMAQKLEIMRQKKHEYLEMQRQLALQRLQEQEREMQMRLEQQKQLTHMRQMQSYIYPQPPPYPQGPMQGAPHGFSPNGSPVHQIQQGQHTPQQGQYMGHMGPQQMVSSHQMYVPSSSQAMYSQAGAPGHYQQPYDSMAVQGQSLSSQVGYSTVTSGYNVADGSSVPQHNIMGVYPQMSYSTMGHQSPPSSLPVHVSQGNQGYTSLPQTSMSGGGGTEYQSFNMQGMVNALPTEPVSFPPQQYLPPPQGQYHQGGGPSTQSQGMVHPPQHVPAAGVAELISFD